MNHTLVPPQLERKETAKTISKRVLYFHVHKVEANLSKLPEQLKQTPEFPRKIPAENRE